MLRQNIFHGLIDGFFLSKQAPFVEVDVLFPMVVDSDCTSYQKRKQNHGKHREINSGAKGKVDLHMERCANIAPERCELVKKQKTTVSRGGFKL